MRQGSRNSGFSLLEVLLASSILMIFLMPLISLQLKNFRITIDFISQDYAEMEAGNWMERVIANIAQGNPQNLAREEQDWHTELKQFLPAAHTELEFFAPLHYVIKIFWGKNDAWGDSKSSQEFKLQI